MKMIYFISFVLLLDLLIYPIRADTIIDSVYTVPDLDGYIAFELPTEIFVVNNWMYDLNTGDQMLNGMGGSQIPNTHFRSYLTFTLPEIPVGYEIDSVNVRLYQWISHGNLNYLGIPQSDFPIWDVAGGDTIKCIMSHIDYGYELDSLDWSKGDHSNPYTFTHNIGTITESGEDGYRYLDVTDCVLQDYSMGRSISQYRIAFQIDTDWDDLADQVGFSSAESFDEESPLLFFYLSDNVSIEDNNINFINVQLQVYPNPLSESGMIRLTSKQPFFVDFNIYNIKGQLVQTVWRGNIEKGDNEIFIDTGRISNGIYLLRAKKNNCVSTKKIIIIK